MTAWRWLLWRAAAIVVRTPAYWAATAFHVIALAAFLLVWGDGVPTIAGSVLDQLSAAQRALLLVLLPWVAGRCGAGSRSFVTRIAAVGAQAPARLLTARAAALVIALGVCTATGLPMLVLAARISAAPGVEAVAAVLRLAPLVVFVAVLTTWCEVVVTDRLAAWIVATTATLTVGVALPAATGSAVLALGAAVGAVAFYAADSRLRYLPDQLPRGAR
jgi:hypothetical protein